MAAAYRSALSQLLESDGPADEARHYALKMLAEFPFSAKNLLRAGQWALRRILPI
jgi:hypothetical protein